MAPRRLLQAVQPAIAAATLKPSQLLALQAFDVAFRTGSFKSSAQFLNLSPSAVSHRIRNLEQALGLALFVRTHRAIHRPPRASCSPLRPAGPLPSSRVSDRRRRASLDGKD